MSGDGGIGEVLAQDMGLPVQDLVPLLDSASTDGFREVALSGSGWSQKEGVLVFDHNVAGSEVVDGVGGSSSC
jgi:hypothetical protein